MTKLIVLLFCCVSLHTQGQNFLSWKYNERYYSLAVGTGMATYFGELNDRNQINERIRQVNVGLEARLLSHFSARVEGIYFELSGSDRNAASGSFAQQRNLSFASYNFETNLQVIYYFRRYNEDYFSRWNIDPYIAGGIGLMWYYPYALLADERYFLRPLPTEPDKAYGVAALVFPLSAGVKFKINAFINVNVEAGYRFTRTDYLDDVSTTIPETFPSFTVEALSIRKDEIPLVNLEAYNLLVPGGPRGDATTNDHYLFIALKVEMFLPPGLFNSKSAAFKKSSSY